MKPGRELDALVAEKVMGLKFEDAEGADQLEYWDKAGAYKKTEWRPVWKRYSTDIAAALDVVEKLKSLNSELQINLSSSGEYPDEWEVEIEWYPPNGGELNGPFFITEKSAPHAICLAALKVVGALT
jgi:hypothetical protein